MEQIGTNRNIGNVFGFRNNDTPLNTYSFCNNTKEITQLSNEYIILL